MAAFKKNDAVLKIARWNNKGQFSIVPATVLSCGKKQMVLHRRGNEIDCLGRNFLPQVAQYDLGEVIADVPADQAEAHALELSAAWIAREISRYENILVKYTGTSLAYIQAINADLEAIRACEPSFLWDA